jgi:hypothetical protein
MPVSTPSTRAIGADFGRLSGRAVVARGAGGARGVPRREGTS